MTRPAQRDDYAPYFGAVIRRLREERGWTMKYLASRVPMHNQHLGELEKGVNLPTLRMVFDIAEALGVRAGDIVEEVESVFRPKPQ